MSDRQDEARSAVDEPPEPAVLELSDDALDAVSGGKEAAMIQSQHGG